ncbi:MAG: asparagine synthase (glutamine-hydrolyzing) [Oscillospiraceae bacterium]|nr:asparagine synthase (glutamine-hydrolyzing) [Oscillospiraceae bacterium]
MCGFVGFFDDNNQDEKNNIIKRMNSKIIHRGPDSDGFFVDDNVAIGFRRLSIIDLAGGDQPMYNENKNLLLFFNGEIYNFKEIRAELLEKGHVFTTSCDAEVILHGYEEYGEEIASKLRGMFSFVIYNAETHDLYGARDYFGIKPFYYYFNKDDKTDKLFMFGSEIKGFMPHPKFNKDKKQINKDALKMYLIFQYSVLEETFFKNVFKLQQGCYFTYNSKENDLKITRYFDISYNTEEKPFAEYVNILDETLKSSVAYHEISDVEVGSFLSGGVDSSFIASTAKPDKTFSVGFAMDGFDESMYAKDLSDILHINNYKKIVSSDEFFDALPMVQYHSDEPHANLSAVPLYYLSKMAAEKVKVVLSGEGSDELFAGYVSFSESPFSKIYSKLPFGFRRFVKKAVKPLPNFKGKRTLIDCGQKVEDNYIGQAFIMNDSEANDILSNVYKNNMSYKDVTKPYFDKVKGRSDLIKKLYLDLFLWLPNDILLKADKMTMAHSLELRVPFLDKEVFAVASKIPTKYLVKNKVTKRVFREVANRVIPSEWAKRKKVGFPVPFTLWLKEEKYCDVLKSIFSETFVSEFFIKDKLFSMLNEHFNGVKNNGRKLYTIYSFLLWYKVYFIEK